MDFTSLFYQEPYRKEFEAELLACRPYKEKQKNDKGELWEVELSRSCFYPEGGGQPGDRGKLRIWQEKDNCWSEAYPVLDTYYRENRQWHLIAGPELAPGSKIKGQIDFERRFTFMQQHTGEHLISGFARQFFGVTNVGFNINETEMTLDFDKFLNEEDLQRLENAVNEAVFQNLPVEVLYPSADELEELDYRSKKALEGQVRLIRIPGVDLCACCGTHLIRTGEVGLVKIVHSLAYKGGVRLTAYCGRRALADYRHLAEEARTLSQAYSVEARKLVPDLLRPLEQVAELNKELSCRQQQLLSLLAELRQPEGLLWLDSGLDKSGQKNLAKWSTTHAISKIFIFVPQGEEIYRYVFAAQDFDLAPYQAVMAERFEVRGGGRNGFFQGQVKASEGDLLALFAEFAEDIYVYKTLNQPDEE
ncbi:MAG: alanyl-tRNA editing protein [Eubacteriales bacterium]|nr:alanyl-tRNA editing protein [Eubacteriales bacterium]